MRCSLAAPIARLTVLAVLLSGAAGLGTATAAEPGAPRQYDNTLMPIKEPSAILADHPQFVQPLKEARRFAAAPVIDDEGADLAVRSWRYSYNARGVIEMRNRLRSDATAVIVVHPWGIDDTQGWQSPEPAGVAFFCTPEKNQVCRRHVEKIVNPLLKSLRSKLALTMYSLPGKEDPIRKKLYRSFHGRPNVAQREAGAKELAAKLRDFSYRGQPLPAKLALNGDTPTPDYFRQYPALDAGDRFNGKGFWDLPVPVIKEIDVDPADVVIYDGDGYGALRDYLKKQKVRHVLLAGYCTDMCVCSTTAGYENLRQDFDVLLVGDATLATFPASDSPAAATSTAVASASLKVLVTQASWIEADK